MAQLAIQGHATRGREVIELLEMLGGVNKYHINFTEENLLYSIRKYDNVIIGTYYNTSISKTFSLEEFLEKFPYKVGDKVSVYEYESKVRIDDMKWNGFEIQYSVFTDETEWYSAAELNELNKCNNPYKEETMENKEETMEVNNEKSVNHVYDVEIISFDNAQNDRYELDLRGKFDVKLREGKYYIERIKPKYPKTYEECCEVLALTRAYQSVSGYRTELLEQFQELLICRDAYWKIAGEQMGLGQPWKPDWENKDHESYPSIVVCGGEIVKSTIYTHDNPFAFPTKEMRDAFKEYFNMDLETCKELL